MTASVGLGLILAQLFGVAMRSLSGGHSLDPACYVLASVAIARAACFEKYAIT